MHFTKSAGAMLLLAMAGSMLTARASATIVDFGLTGSRNASFSLDTSKAPSNSTFFQAQYYDVAGTFNGQPGIAPTISFGASSLVSAIDISGTSLGFSQFGGPVLFTGTTANPVFTDGTYSLFGIVAGSSTLTITSLPSAPVPEPGSWSLLLGALAVGGIGLAFRRKTQSPAN